MNHVSARSAVDELFIGRGRKLGELRAHLDGCIECRAHYDHTARAFRALGGRPDQMTPEELLLFVPAFPEQAPSRARWPMFWLGGLAAAAAAALVVYVQFEPTEFTARSSTPVAERRAMRVLCSHDDGSGPVVTDATEGKCANGDHLGFVAIAQGTTRRPPFVAVALLDSEGNVEVVVSGREGSLLNMDRDVVLANTSTWRPGLRVVAISAEAPIGPEVAEKCARGQCLAPFERIELALDRSKP